MPVSKKRKKKPKRQKNPWEPSRMDVIKDFQEVRKRQPSEPLESPFRLRELLERYQSLLDESNAEKQTKEVDQPPSLWPTQGTALPTQPTLWEVPSPPG
jgi:hypothetical protein